MLISHSHKFITIDIPKTGTRSLRETLIPLGIIDIVGVPITYESVDFHQHGNIVHAKQGFEKKGWNWDEYLKYTNVRNPWKRYASFVNYQKNNANRFKRATAEDLKDWPQIKINQGKNCCKIFDRFNWNDKAYLKHILQNHPSQHSYLIGDKGELKVDIIGQTETIDESFTQFCEAVNISPSPTLGHGNKSDYQKAWQDLYDQETIDMVAKKEEWAIEAFKYSYE